MIVRTGSPGRDAYVLECFEAFRIDDRLPKHRVDVPEDAEEGGFKLYVNPSRLGSIMSGPDTFVERPVPLGWRERLVSWFAARLGVSFFSRNNIPIVFGGRSPVEMFAFVRGSLEEAGKYVERMKAFERGLERAKSLGQTVLAEKLEKGLGVIMGESVLLAAGYAKYVTEKQVVEFALKCKKGIRLDWIANFTGAIPEHALKRKAEADGLKVFDNYLVMHYDPLARAFGLTQQEIEAKRDPILFGAISGARKLYFVADWVSKEDDLTLDEVSKVLGHAIDEIGTDPTSE
jgi:hypothetical protein